MKTTFVLIAFNESVNIADCIDSIMSQNGLTSFEIIVVNDASTDETAEIVSKIACTNNHVKLIDLKTNHGRGFARATGLAKAKGELLAFVDSDIVLPPDWYNICLHNLKNKDAVGGVAVPDGDICYIFNTFKLSAKVVLHPTTITGNNGLYRKLIFDKIPIDKQLRDGEDIDYNNRLISNGFKLFTINDLIVMHKESKGFYDSLVWLYQSGIGASRQLRVYKKIRFPDLAYFGFIFTIPLLIMIAIILQNMTFLIGIIIYPLLISCAHIYTKFYLKRSSFIKYFVAWFVNWPLITSYFVGRTVGLTRQLS